MEQTETGACAEGLENMPVQEDRTDRTRAEQFWSEDFSSFRDLVDGGANNPDGKSKLLPGELCSVPSISTRYYTIYCCFPGQDASF